jgi:integrase
MAFSLERNAARNHNGMVLGFRTESHSSSTGFPTIQPKARDLGIKKRLSLAYLPPQRRIRNSRHTFSTPVKAGGTDVKVVQELLRHSTSRITLDTYTQALTPDKRDAQSRLTSVITYTQSQPPGVFSIRGITEKRKA